MIDFDATVLDPIYGTLGVAAEITPPSEAPYAVTVIDRTDGEVAEFGAEAAAVALVPAVRLRKSEAPATIVGSTLVLHGRTYAVRAAVPVLSRAGVASGELSLQLEELS